MTQTLVSVAVVSYNTKDKLRKCLQAIEPGHEVVVVDNASLDGSAEMVCEEFPNAVLIRNRENLGFGAANNQAAAAATRPFVLYLNSDAYAEPGAIDRLAAVFADSTIAGAGGRLLNPDLSLQNSTANELTLLGGVLRATLFGEVIFRLLLVLPLLEHQEAGGGAVSRRYVPGYGGLSYGSTRS